MLGLLAEPHSEHATQRAVTDKLNSIEGERDLSRSWLHIDMDAFFAAVEERTNPALKGGTRRIRCISSIVLIAGTAFAVGGMGMISTASYSARAFGVRSAMPGFIGRRLCPHLVFVAPDFSKYSAAAGEVGRHLLLAPYCSIVAGTLLLAPYCWHPTCSSVSTLLLALWQHQRRQRGSVVSGYVDG